MGIIDKIKNNYKIKIPNGYSTLPILYVFNSKRCNLKCKMCNYNSDNNGPNEITFSSFKKLVDEIKILYRHSYTKPTIHLSGGEIFLFKDIIKTLDYIDLKNIPFLIATNGTLINEDIAKRISEYKNLININFSIDGPKQVHDKIRNFNGAFDKTINAIKLINKMDIKNEKLKSITCTISDYNQNHLEKVLHIAKYLKIKIVRFNHLRFRKIEKMVENENIINSCFNKIYSERINIKDGKPIINLDVARLIKKIQFIRKKAKELNIRLLFHPNLSHAEISNYYLNPENIKNNKVCITPWNILRIMSDGSIKPCIFNYDLGDIRKDTIKSIYNNKKIRNFRKFLQNGNHLPICIRCCKYKPV